jgi:NAD(P)-dependent dehydrogenase (short-subunit alcohol dehydrogenase family)
VNPGPGDVFKVGTPIGRDGPGAYQLVEDAGQQEQRARGAVVRFARCRGPAAPGTEREPEAVGPRRAYNSMKAALLPYAKLLARNLAPKIRCNVVSPGQVFFEGGVWDYVRQAQPDIYAENLRRNPMGRMGTAEEIASVVAFLASPRAGFVSGANVICDGARTEGIQY